MKQQTMLSTSSIKPAIFNHIVTNSSGGLIFVKRRAIDKHFFLAKIRTGEKMGKSQVSMLFKSFVVFL